MSSFISSFRKMWSPENHIQDLMPKFSGTRIMMMPVRLGLTYGVPMKYVPLLEYLYGMVESRWINEIGYLTIDEREVKAGDTLRRPGLHVDGYYHGRCGAWGGGGTWGSVGNGMLTVSSTAHCMAYMGAVVGTPGPEGECDHLDTRHLTEHLFEANTVYWVDGACVHRSMPVLADTKRQFIRLSMPSNGPWFEGYTKNPCGIMPSHDILPARDEFMENNA